MKSKLKYILKRVVLWSDAQILQIILISIIFFAIIILFVMTKQDMLTLVDITILSTFLITFFATLSFNKIIDFLRIHVEDDIKITQTFKGLEKKYPIDIQNNSFYSDEEGYLWPIIVLYNHRTQQLPLHIIDSETMYKLPDYINLHTDRILEAHKKSEYNNAKVIRMDNVKTVDGRLNIYTSRTTYLNGLLTNRAIDYMIGKMSIRDILEPGPYINTLGTSLLSNHIGFNIILFDEDNNIVFSKRTSDVTSQKNKIAFGVSGSLKAAYALNRNYSLEMRGIEEAIIKEIEDELGLKRDNIDFDIQKDLLNIYREVYEGGKPHFLLKARIKMNSGEIEESFHKNKNLGHKGVDSNQLLFIPYSQIINADIYADSITFEDGYSINFAKTLIAPLKIGIDNLRRNNKVN